jgi:formate dehydrogenase subunit gamma|tara:strand:- start:387208 stop:387663 length:456 start_codon:yes stop_codon:yes gene_type:complete
MTDLTQAADIVERFKKMPGGLLECLHAVQAAFGYVPKETVDIMADGFNISRAEVHGVISYYHDFRTSPSGRTVVRVCQAEACQAMGSRELTDRIVDLLGLNVGETSKDYTLDAVYCFGNCALSPNVEINGTLHPRVSSDNFEKLVKAGGAS